MNTELLHILQHSLGVDRYGQGNQYRNHYVTPPDGPDGKKCEELVAMGFLTDHGPQSLASGMHCFTVTPAGVDAVALESPAPPKLSRSKQRYLDYLRADCGWSFAEYLGIKEKARP